MFTTDERMRTTIVDALRGPYPPMLSMLLLVLWFEGTVCDDFDFTDQLISTRARTKERARVVRLQNIGRDPPKAGGYREPSRLLILQCRRFYFAIVRFR